MKCPCCGYSESKVIDSRPVEEGNSIRRRRECLACQKRFNTFEVLESVQIIVIKKSGEKELFDRTKLLAGVLKATQKRPVNADEIVSEIEAEIQNSLNNEIESAKIGEMVEVSLAAEGEGLTYQWHYKNKGSNTWRSWPARAEDSKSSLRI